MPDRVTITLSQIGVLRALKNMLPVMRARRDLTTSSGDLGLAGAFAKHLAQNGFTVSKEVDAQYLDILTRDLGSDGFTHGR